MHVGLSTQSKRGLKEKRLKCFGRARTDSRDAFMYETNGDDTTNNGKKQEVLDLQVDNESVVCVNF